MGRLAIFDTEHFEVLGTLLRLFEPWGHEITVYSDLPTQQQVQFVTGGSQRIRWFTRIADESKRAFIRRCFKDLGQSVPELLFLSSTPDNHAVFAWYFRQLGNIPVLLTLHDINSYYRTPSRWSFNAWVRAAGKKMLLRRVDAVHVLGQQQAVYLREKKHYRKPILVIPGAIYSGNPPALFDKPVRIVVPGSVDNRRRDYGQVFGLLEIAAAQGIDIRITLLGSFSNEHAHGIRNRCIEWSQQHGNLHFFDDGVIDQPEFDRVLAGSHFLWVPLRERLVLEHGITEEYGRSITSGNIGDMIRSARPMILPATLVLDEALEKGAIRYASIAGLAALLQGMDGKSYAALAEETVMAADGYTVQTITAGLPAFFKGLRIG